MTIIRTMTTFCQLATENMVEKLMAEMPMPTIWIQTSLLPQKCWQRRQASRRFSGMRLKMLAKAAKMIM